METQYDDLIARLRAAAEPERAAPAELTGYLEKVRLYAYKVTDRDVDELKVAGITEDEIFEHTVSAAVAAGLERVDAGAGELRQRLGREPSGVLLTLYYRPDLFGRPFSDALDLAMRGPSDWSAGERELFAAFVSSLNQCPF